VQGRGAFYETAGCLRDVVENHLFQVVALLAMEPPAYQGFGAVQSEKFSVFKAMRPLAAGDVVRGQFTGYRDEPGVAADSDVETFCALRLFIDSWRWAGVPWYVRSGKCLAQTAAEVLVELKPPPQPLFTDSAPTAGRANYLRFRLSPSPVIALAAWVKRAGEEFTGDQRELVLLNAQPDEEQPYERRTDPAARLPDPGDHHPRRLARRRPGTRRHHLAARLGPGLGPGQPHPPRPRPRHHPGPRRPDQPARPRTTQPGTITPARRDGQPDGRRPDARPAREGPAPAPTEQP
jgi:hypothetical protein